MEYNRFKKNITIDNEKIIEDLNKIIDDDMFIELQSSYGAGGANNSSDYLCAKLIDQIPNRYSKLERNLKKIKYIKKGN